MNYSESASLFTWKIPIVILIVLVTVLLQKSQGEIADMEQETIITTEQMNKNQLQEWNSLFDFWLRNKFRPNLRILHYKQDCIQCGDIYFSIRFYVDMEGHISKYKIIREEIDCSGKTVRQNDELRKTIINDFEAWVFPPSLRNKIIEAKMGEVTRC